MLAAAPCVVACGVAPSDGDVAVPDTDTATTSVNPAAGAPPAPATPDTIRIASGSRPDAVDGPAEADATSTRVDPPPRDDCERIARRIGATHSDVTYLVIVRTVTWVDTDALLQVATRPTPDGRWTCDEGRDAKVGRSGTRPLLERRSGDGTTPAGTFPLATMTAWDGRRFSFFGNDPDPGVVGGAYRDVVAGDCFGATPGTPGYGHLRFDTACPGPDDEYLPRFVQAYTHAALIGANMEPDVSGDEPGETPYAAAIFLHRHVYDAAGRSRPTSGCVSVGQDDLVEVLTSMPADTLFVIGPTDWLLADPAAV